MKLTLILRVFLLFFPLLSIAQEPIYLENASFEGEIGKFRTPPGWQSSLPDSEIQPDIQSPDFKELDTKSRNRLFPEALEGASYLALYTDFMSESAGISQRLSAPMEAGYCYLFKLFARSSSSLKPTKDANKSIYYKPVRIRIWGSPDGKEKGELLAESRAVRQRYWCLKEFLLEPLENWNYLIIDAHYDETIEERYDGKILLDNASPIAKIDCETIDYEGLDNATYSFDPVMEYQAYMTRFLNENWKRATFVYEEAELQKGAISILQEIVETTNEAYHAHKLYFAVGQGKGGLKNERVEVLRKTLKEMGLKSKYFYVGVLMSSDFQKEWDAKNNEIWIRLTYY